MPDTQLSQDRTNIAHAPLRIYFVMGEVSGDNLGSDLIDGFDEIGRSVEPLGLGGEKMQKKGLSSLFDISDIAVMGLSGVVAKLPAIYKRIRQTAADILAQKPDVVLLIDSPEFSFAVAKRVRKQNPDIPIIKYVCPSVWAWRPGRAPKMREYLDHILAILPFEPAVLEELGGPPATYIGHPLMRLIGENTALDKKIPNEPPLIAVCPGSRKSEIIRLMPIIRDTVNLLYKRGNSFRLGLPAVAHLETQIRRESADWRVEPEIILGEEGRQDLFRKADAAIAASGTVTLELALYKTPMVSIYKLDPAMTLLQPFIHGWTASLPNLIADTSFIPEKFNRYAHSENIARTIEQLLVAGPARDAQLQGFELVAENMAQEERPRVLAARKILDVAGRN